VILWSDKARVWRICPLSNEADRFHAEDPARFPHTSRTAYHFDPHPWLALLEEADTREERVVCVFHSHVNGIADFSAEDRDQAAPDGQPLLPRASYLVVSVVSGRAVEARIFRWVDGVFLDRRVPIPG
jgi:[CysO sulfur-carrier protein]-S-L-cysteine hydrolase